MDSKLRLQFRECMSRLEGKEYLAAFVAYEAAPTIDGYKPSSLLSFHRRGKNRLELWKRYGREITRELGLEFFELKERQESRLVLFYQQELLACCINDERVEQFLKQFGYRDAVTMGEKLQVLKQRFSASCPHEVGVFLGIPLADVACFIKHRGKRCLFCKEWKVYRNPQRAEKLFREYDRSRDYAAISALNHFLPSAAKSYCGSTAEMDRIR